jgi:hypothetical protein
MERQDKIDFIAQSIARAKKVMEKTETISPTGNKSIGGGKQVYTEEQYDNMDVDNTQYLNEEQVRRMGAPAPKQQQRYELYEDNEREIPMIPQQSSQQTPQYRPYKNLNSTNMPKQIVESFLKKPMIDPTQPLGMETIFEKVHQKEQAARPAPSYEQKPKAKPQPVYEERPTQSGGGMDMQLLEFVIKKTVEETLKQVSEQTNINENIQIKIGEKTFGGTIKSLKTIKK